MNPEVSRPTTSPRRAILRTLLAGLIVSVLLPAGDGARLGQGLLAAPRSAGTLSNDDIAALISEMTLSEEVSMVQGALDNTCSGVNVSPAVQGCMGQAGYVPGVSRLGIPPLRLSDGPTGVKLSHVETALPAPIGLAATFDPEEALAYGRVLGREGRASNQDVILAPMINLYSLPTDGRGFETLGEDPYLLRQMLTAEVSAISSEGLISTLKHLAMNEFENGRTTTSVAIGDQSLHDLELRAFGAGFKAGAGAVMCAYGRVNDVYSCSSDTLMNGQLKGIYGFTGWVMSDWGATHRTSDLVHGLDMAMPRGTAANGWDTSTLITAVNNGTAEVPLTNDFPAVPAIAASQWKQALDEAVFRILFQMNRAGLLEGTPYGSQYSGGLPIVPQRPDLDSLRAADAAAALRIATSSAVLLKNEGGALPIQKNPAPSGILVMGPAAIAPYIGGGGSSHGRPYDPVTGPYEALLAAAGPSADIRYVPGYDLDGVVVPSQALTSPDATNPWPDWTLDSDDEPLSNEPGLLRQQITTDAVAPGMQPLLETGPGAAPDRVDSTIDATGSGALPAGSAWRWTGLFTAPVGGDWQLKVFAAGQEEAQLFVDGLDAAHKVIDIGAYPSPPTRSFAALYEEERSHDPDLPHLEQSTWQVTLTAGQVLHLDLRLVAGANGPAEMQLRWIRPGWQQSKINEAVVAAAAASKVILFAFDDSREGRDRGGDEPGAGLALPGYQDELIEAVASVNDSTVVVLNTGGPILMPWIDDVRAVLEMWYPGQMGGAATADILLGNASPGGKLPVTFPPDASHYPQYDPGCTDTSPQGNCPLYPGKALTGFLGTMDHGYRTIDFMSNGIFVGYRWYDREGVRPLFEFGHGLSYTTFRYSDLRLIEHSGGGIRVRFRLQNTGYRTGDEVVQIYVGPGSQVPSGAQQALRKLVQFERVTLRPGESKSLSLFVPARELSNWSTAYRARRRSQGARHVYVGASSRDIRLRGRIRIR